MAVLFGTNRKYTDVVSSGREGLPISLSPDVVRRITHVGVTAMIVFGLVLNSLGAFTPIKPVSAASPDPAPPPTKLMPTFFGGQGGENSVFGGYTSPDASTGDKFVPFGGSGIWYCVGVRCPVTPPKK